MTYSEIKIKINEEVGFGSLFSITVLKGVVPFTFKEKWVKVRRNRFEVTRGKPTSIVGQRSASDFLTSFNFSRSFDSLLERILLANLSKESIARMRSIFNMSVPIPNIIF